MRVVWGLSLCSFDGWQAHRWGGIASSSRSRGIVIEAKSPFYDRQQKYTPWLKHILGAREDARPPRIATRVRRVGSLWPGARAT
jgi:hypothetical protein